MLRELGWSVSVWLPGRGPLLQLLSGAGASVTVGPERPFAFSLRRLRSGDGARPREIVRYQIAFARFLRESQPHVLHANTLLALPEATAAFRYGIPVVAHVHELPPRSAKTRVALAILRRVAATTVAVAPEVADLLSWGLPPSQIRIVRNGVETRGSVTPRRRAAPLRVGTVAAASRRKGTDVFLQAAEMIASQRDDVRFVHIGSWDAETDKEFLEAVRVRAELLCARGSLEICGEVTSPRELLSQLDVFVLPSRQDPYPLALLEAMAEGVPAVATAVGGIPGIIKNGLTGLLIEPGSPEALVRGIETLLNDPERAWALADNARSQVAMNNSLKQQAQRISSIYLETIADAWRPSAYQPIEVGSQ